MTTLKQALITPTHRYHRQERGRTNTARGNWVLGELGNRLLLLRLCYRFQDWQDYVRGGFYFENTCVPHIHTCGKTLS